jgi:hypothetical protein
VAIRLCITAPPQPPNPSIFANSLFFAQWHQYCDIFSYEEEAPPMKTLTLRLLLPAAGLSLLLLLMPGCYTQFGTAFDEHQQYVAQEDDEYIPEDSVSQEDYDQARAAFYDDTYGYYPQSQASFGYGYGNDWGYYDPIWGWCGSGIYGPRYYSGWPYYGYGYGYGYLPYGHGYSHHGGGGYATQGRGRGTTRTFGATRSSGNVRGGSSGAYGSGTTRSGFVGGGELPGARANGGARGSAVGSSGSRGSSSSGNRSGSVGRSTTRSAPRPDSGARSGRRDATYVPPPTYGGSSGSSSSGRDGGGGRASAPASAPASSPAPSGNSGGSSAPTNTGDRGGNRR